MFLSYIKLLFQQMSGKVDLQITRAEMAQIILTDIEKFDGTSTDYLEEQSGSMLNLIWQTLEWVSVTQKNE